MRGRAQNLGQDSTGTPSGELGAVWGRVSRQQVHQEHLSEGLFGERQSAFQPLASLLFIHTPHPRPHIHSWVQTLAQSQVHTAPDSTISSLGRAVSLWES